MSDAETTNLPKLTADIVSAYVSNNSLPAANLAELISTVYAAVSGLSKPVPQADAQQIPAVKPRRSVFPDYLVCLEDGKRFKSLTRHLRQFGLTPDEYREKWSLPRDYPMVAPNYSATRSVLAKQYGLGRKAGTKVKRTTKARER